MDTIPMEEKCKYTHKHNYHSSKTPSTPWKSSIEVHGLQDRTSCLNGFSIDENIDITYSEITYIEEKILFGT